MKVALVYDRVNKFGGAERVLQVLHELFPEAPIYTSVYNKKTARWADEFEIHPSFLQNVPFAKTNHELIAPFIPLAFESFNFSEYDLVISVTSEYAKAIITKPQTIHICYCLTPTRYLWSGYSEYFKHRVFRLLTKPLVSYLRNVDKVASRRPDKYIAISQVVAERIKKYYGQDAEVIYPPMSLESSLTNLPHPNLLPRSSREQALRGEGEKEYFLVVSRLVAYKNIDIAIKACNQLKQNLVIVGEGREYSQLKKIAGPTIYFLKNLTDDILSRYYQNCTALIFPGNEDLGLAMVEAQYFGKPVIALREGGALEIVHEGKSGEFFYPATKKALLEVLKNFDPKRYNRKEAQKQARKFAKQQFKRNFFGLIDSYYKKQQYL